MTLGKPLGCEPHFCHKYSWTTLHGVQVPLPSELFDDLIKYVNHEKALRQSLQASLIVPHLVHMETFL